MNNKALDWIQRWCKNRELTALYRDFYRAGSSGDKNVRSHQDGWEATPRH